MSSLPDWMHADTASEDWTAAASSRRRGGSVVRRALRGLAALMSLMVADDACAAGSGVLQGIDARVKAVSLIGLVVIATLVHSLAALGLLYGLCVLLAASSRVSVKRFAGVWLVVPLFSAAIMLPATLNVVTDGSPIWTIVHFTRERFGAWALPRDLAVTDAGLLAAARMVLRTAVCVSLATLLAATTPRARLFRGLRALGVPQLFVALLAMMDRYLGVVIRAAQEIHLAKLSRSISPGNVRGEQAWVAAGIASVFRRSHALSQAVYLAMISRGYTGEVRLLNEPRPQPRDWAFAAAAAAYAALALVIG